MYFRCMLFELDVALNGYGEEIIGQWYGRKHATLKEVSLQ